MAPGQQALGQRDASVRVVSNLAMGASRLQVGLGAQQALDQAEAGPGDAIRGSAAAAAVGLFLRSGSRASYGRQTQALGELAVLTLALAVLSQVRCVDDYEFYSLFSRWGKEQIAHLSDQF